MAVKRASPDNDKVSMMLNTMSTDNRKVKTKSWVAVKNPNTKY